MEGMTPARGNVDACLQANRAERQACQQAHGVHQQAAGRPMDGMGSKGGNPHRRMLPQLSRFGMKVAQEGI